MGLKAETTSFAYSAVSIKHRSFRRRSTQSRFPLWHTRPSFPRLSFLYGIKLAAYLSNLERRRGKCSKFVDLLIKIDYDGFVAN